jgi:hypothetical protein
MKLFFKVFALCALPVHLWTILNMLRDVPAWAMRMDLWETIGAVSYTLSFALLESILLTLPLLIVFLLASRRWPESYISSLLTLMIMEATVTAIIVHFSPELYLRRRQVVAIFLVIYLCSAVPLLLAVVRWPQIGDNFRGVIERIQPLTYVYLAFDLTAVAIITLRNIFPG